MRKKLSFQIAYLGLIYEHTYRVVIILCSVMTFNNNGLTFDFCMKYLLLELTDSGLTNMSLISGCLGIITPILQTYFFFSEINVS